MSIRRTVNDWTARAVSACSTVPALVSQGVVVLLWAACGPLLGFSDRWYLLIGTYSAIVTTVLAFAILNAQRRGDQALHAKLDALIHYLDVPNDYVDLDGQTLEHIEAVRKEIRGK